MTKPTLVVNPYRKPEILREEEESLSAMQMLVWYGLPSMAIGFCLLAWFLWKLVHALMAFGSRLEGLIR